MRIGMYGAQTLLLLLVIVPNGKQTSLPDNMGSRKTLLCQDVFPGAGQ